VCLLDGAPLVILPPPAFKRAPLMLIRNPTIEEQALARIHRIGQKKEVTTVRFFVKDTFEEVSSLSSQNSGKSIG